MTFLFDTQWKLNPYLFHVSLKNEIEKFPEKYVYLQVILRSKIHICRRKIRITHTVLACICVIDYVVIMQCVLVFRL